MKQHRAEAVCRFCDTDFVGTDGPGGGVFPTPRELADAAARTWSAATGSPPTDDPGGGSRSGRALIVCTGGEPLLQLDAALTAAFGEVGFEVAIETNGTIPVPEGVDWVCVSPKAGSEVVVRAGDELKLVYPQRGRARAVHRFGVGLRALSAATHGRTGPRGQHGRRGEYCRTHPGGASASRPTRSSAFPKPAWSHG